MTTEDVTQILKAECHKAGSQTKWAKQHGVCRSLVQRIIQGKDKLTPQIALALGLKRVASYEYRR